MFELISKIRCTKVGQTFLDNDNDAIIQIVDSPHNVCDKCFYKCIEMSCNNLCGDRKISFRLVGFNNSLKFRNFDNHAQTVIDKNATYYYKEKPYRILHETKIKINGEWVDGIVYVTLYDCPSGTIFVRTKEEFFDKFKTK